MASDDTAMVKTCKSTQRFDRAEDVADLIEEIGAKQDTLQTIDLEGNSYGIESLRVIGEALSTCHDVRHLLLNDMFVSRLKSEIPEALTLLFGGICRSDSQIETLTLNDNAIGPVTMPALLPFLESTACSNLRVLRLNNCGLGTAGGHMLSTVLHRLESLRELVIGRNRLEIDGVRDIAQALSRLSSIEVLELPQNGTKSDAIGALAEAIGENRDLRVLNLNDNVLKSNGERLAAVLRHLDRLEIINFGDCLLQSDGCAAIMAALLELINRTADRCELREIILNGNEIGKSAAVSVIMMIDRLLYMRSGDEDDAEIRRRLKIDLSGNNLGDETVEMLRAQYAAHYAAIELIVEDDEGSADERTAAEAAAEDDDDNYDPDHDYNAADYYADEDDDDYREHRAQIEHRESSFAKNQDQTNGGDSALEIEQLVTKFETEFGDYRSLASEFFRRTTRGYIAKTCELTAQAKAEVAAIVRVGIALETKNNNNNDGDNPAITGTGAESSSSSFEFVNALLVACGLLKCEDRAAMPARGQSIVGALLGLGAALRHLRDPMQRKCVAKFLEKALEDERKFEPLKPALFSYIYSF